MDDTGNDLSIFDGLLSKKTGPTEKPGPSAPPPPGNARAPITGPAPRNGHPPAITPAGAGSGGFEHEEGTVSPIFDRKTPTRQTSAREIQAAFARNRSESDSTVVHPSLSAHRPNGGPGGFPPPPPPPGKGPHSPSSGKAGPTPPPPFGTSKAPPPPALAGSNLPAPPPPSLVPFPPPPPPPVPKLAGALPAGEGLASLAADPHRPKTVLGLGPPPAAPPPPAGLGLRSSLPPGPPHPPQAGGFPSVGPGRSLPAPPHPPNPLAPPVSAGAHLGSATPAKPKVETGEVDWDDEDEVTEIFNRETHDAPGYSLGSGGQEGASSSSSSSKVPVAPFPQAGGLGSMPPPVGLPALGGLGSLGSFGAPLPPPPLGKTGLLPPPGMPPVPGSLPGKPASLPPPPASVPPYPAQQRSNSLGATVPAMPAMPALGRPSPSLPPPGLPGPAPGGLGPLGSPAPGAAQFGNAGAQPGFSASPRKVPVPSANRWSDPGQRRKTLQWAAIAAGVVLVGLLLFFVTRPGSATLLVTVSGPRDSAVDQVKVIVDGDEKCSQSPCRTELAAGAHIVRVVATGYVKPADRPVVIKSGTDEIVNLTLTPVSEGTGIKVSSLGKGLHLFCDGKDRGELPITIDGLEPGEHEVSISGNDAYKAWTGKVTLSAGEIKELEPKLEIQKGLIRVELGERAEGAQITLECGKDRRVLSPPTTAEVKPQESCRLLAIKRGFEPVTLTVSFEPGQAEKTVRVVFPEPGAAVAAAPAAPTPPTHGSPASVAPRGAAAAGGGATGTISINAIPVSKALVDGRPIGQTPTKVTVAAGNHSVVFINAEKGRKSVTVNVQPGQNAIAAVRF